LLLKLEYLYLSVCIICFKRSHFFFNAEETGGIRKVTRSKFSINFLPSHDVKLTLLQLKEPGDGGMGRWGDKGTRGQGDGGMGGWGDKGMGGCFQG